MSMYFDITIRPFDAVRGTSFMKQRPVNCTIEIYSNEWDDIFRDNVKSLKFGKWIKDDVQPAIIKDIYIKIINR